MPFDVNIVKEVTQLANDLQTKSAFQLSGDLPMVGDALLRITRSLNNLVINHDALDKRVAALEAATKSK